jgi:cysteinyl-tRNA synthetase
MNITDVEDKTIRTAKKEKKPSKELTKFYTKVFFEGAKKLCILPADIYPRATEHVEDMVRLIKKLVEKGYAYKWQDGNIYYDISKFKNYGKLSHLHVTKEMSERKIWKDDYNKWEAGDFILWKSYRKSDGNTFWVSELGKGRPGWNIECSAMSMRYLGVHFDMHTGGVDNIFSHHENEIAQSEGATGKKFVNYWLHSKHLMVNGKKMSKSLGNCYTLQDLLRLRFDPMVLRYVLISTHYRRRLNFTFKKIRKAKAEIGRYYRCMNKVKDLKNEEYNKRLSQSVKQITKKFEQAMDDDLNTTKAIHDYCKFICKLYKISKEGKLKLNEENKREIMQAVKKINSVLGFLLPC